MSGSVKVFGVYPVKAEQPAHLVELFFDNRIEPINFELITQKIDGKPEDNWQTAYDKRILNFEGTEVIADPFPGPYRIPVENPAGKVRAIFFLHYLNFDCPLSAQFGELDSPEAGYMPERLEGLPEFKDPG